METQTKTSMTIKNSHKYVEISSIPMRIYGDRIDYNGTVVPIDRINVSTPFKVVVKTSEIRFSVSAMSQHYVGIEFEPSDLEPDFRYGYNIIERVSFEDIVAVLW